MPQSGAASIESAPAAAAQTVAPAAPAHAPGAGRLRRLDVLRAIAVLLVFARHMRPPEETAPRWLALVSTLGINCGWIGVDLFFVLSGFLVSGLLFREYAKSGGVKIGRFLIRRGLKIYPAFYCLFLATLVAWRIPYLHNMKWMRDLNWTDFLSEGTFVGNYFASVWNHTWSLAVEEHFYIGLSLLLLVLSRSKSNTPFGALVPIGLVLSIGVLAWRVVHWYFYYGTYGPTHLRIDSLFFGVIISYYYHFKPAVFDAFERPVVRIVSILLCAPVLAASAVIPLEEGNFWYTAGYSLLYLAFGLVLILCIKSRVERLPKLVLRGGAVLASVGFYSYSIYLWHMPVRRGLFLVLDKIPYKLPFLVQFALFAGISVGAGIVFAKLIEIPVLKFRDRYFPSRSGDMATLGAAAR